jgi:hypothetical protein
MASIAAELTWITFILKDLRVSLSFTPMLYYDNLSALRITINPVFHAHSKYVELDYHFVGEQVALGLLTTQDISITDQVLNLFTEPMSKAAFKYFQTKLCLQP